ncbi:MAG: hypothetical protein ACKO0V_25220, partial [bacterium]
KNVGPRAGLVGMLCGLAAVSYVKFGTKTAWPWFALVGSSTVIITGLLSSLLIRENQVMGRSLNESRGDA